jgi:hypothetical protein
VTIPTELYRPLYDGYKVYKVTGMNYGSKEETEKKILQSHFWKYAEKPEYYISASSCTG